MSVANDSLLYTLAQQGFPVTDNQNAGSTTANLALPFIGDCLRVVTSVSNGLVMLKSSITNEAYPLNFLINDSPNTVVLKPFTGESLNGSTNGSINVPSGQSCIAVRVPPLISKGGGGGGTGDWRCAAIP